MARAVRGSAAGVLSTRARPTTARSRRQAAMGAEGSLEAAALVLCFSQEKRPAVTRALLS